MLNKELIPKLIHMVWVGNQNIRPDSCINSWKKINPSYEIRIWTDDDLKSIDWLLKPQIEQLWEFELCGVTDLMRWEILTKYGGIAIDADSEALLALPEWLHELEAFCVSENEIIKPGLLSNGFVGTKANNPFFSKLVDTLSSEKCLTHINRWFGIPKRTRAWRRTGPVFFTDAVREEKYSNMTILPSHFMLPKHYTGLEYTGSPIVYARQYWGSTKVKEK